jgi:3'(2'), 5'-bisphosphate nucleotidase
VNIALIENQVPIMGVVYAPAINEMYFSSKELGAFRFQTDRIKDAETIISSAIKLPIKEERTTYRIVASRSHLSKETQDFIDQKEIEHGEIELISKGSSLKLCMIADGSADCYPRYAPTMEWDTAAGQAICLHAGADVIDWNTKKSMIYNRENLLNNWFIVERGV